MLFGCLFFAVQAGDGKKGKGTKDTNFTYHAAINLHHNNVVAIQFTKPSDQRISITIKDANGKIIKFETLKKHNMMVKKYQLSQFPAGNYQVEIASGKDLLIKEITVE